ncbi:MAG: hypothetical protein EOO60_05485 [Hymenobacter sp.]|nr:MAG: hypothetical protein EOO60_05485 [Hymenobacter sp.]
MEEIFVDKAIGAEDVKSCFKELFPGLKLFQWFPWDGDVNPIGFEQGEVAHTLFDIYFEGKRLEFQWRLSIYGQLEGYRERERVIAKCLSHKMLTRTLVTYQLPSEPNDPFYNLVYDNGICYLADDSMFSWTGESDEPSEPIKIVHPMEMLDVKLDAFGKPVK